MDNLERGKWDPGYLVFNDMGVIQITNHGSNQEAVATAMTTAIP